MQQPDEGSGPARPTVGPEESLVFTPEEIASIPGAEDEGGSICLPVPLLFVEDSAELHARACEVLARVANLLAVAYPEETVSIEAYTEHFKPLRKTRIRRRDVGWVRAYAVCRSLADQGIPQAHMIVNSYYLEGTDEAQRQNRRVVIRLGHPEPRRYEKVSERKAAAIVLVLLVGFAVGRLSIHLPVSAQDMRSGVSRSQGPVFWRS